MWAFNFTEARGQTTAAWGQAGLSGLKGRAEAAWSRSVEPRPTGILQSADISSAAYHGADQAGSATRLGPSVGLGSADLPRNT